MTTQNLPGTDAARHGTGDADLTIMIAAHDAFRRDLTRLARTASAANLAEPARRQSVTAGWELFKRELHMHHTAEDEIIWPALRPRLAHSAAALSVLDAMEAEHGLIDPLLAAVDAQFAWRRPPGRRHRRPDQRADRPPGARGAGRPAADRRGPDRRRVARRGPQDRRPERPVGRLEMFAWILDGADRDHAAATLAQLPPPLRLLYRARWKPRFEKTPRW